MYDLLYYIYIFHGISGWHLTKKVIFHDIRMNILLVKFLLLMVISGWWNSVNIPWYPELWIFLLLMATIFHSSARLRPRSPAAPIAPAAVAGAPASNETKEVNLLRQIDTYSHGSGKLELYIFHKTSKWIWTKIDITWYNHNFFTNFGFEIGEELQAVAVCWCLARTARSWLPRLATKKMPFGDSKIVDDVGWCVIIYIYILIIMSTPD